MASRRRQDRARDPAAAASGRRARTLLVVRCPVAERKESRARDRQRESEATRIMRPHPRAARARARARANFRHLLRPRWHAPLLFVGRVVLRNTEKCAENTTRKHKRTSEIIYASSIRNAPRLRWAHRRERARAERTAPAFRRSPRTRRAAPSSEPRRRPKTLLVRQFGAQRGCAGLFRPSAPARRQPSRLFAARRAVLAFHFAGSRRIYHGPGLSHPPALRSDVSDQNICFQNFLWGSHKRIVLFYTDFASCIMISTP